MKVPTPRKLKSGNYFIQLRLGGESISITDPDEKKCIRQAELAKAEHRAGKRAARSAAESKTLGEIIDRYIQDKSKTLSPSTIRAYKSNRNNRMQDYMDRRISTLKKDWQKIIDTEIDDDIKPKTIRNSWGLVAASLEHAGIPAPAVTLPKVSGSVRPWLDADQVKTFVKAVKGQDCEIAALLALHSLRRSEIIGLTWEKIDVKRGQIKVEGSTVYGPEGKLTRKETNKTKKSRRTVPVMIPELQAALEAVPEAERSGQVVKLHPSTIRSQINRICKANDLPEVGVHGLRHSFASLAHHVGLPEQETMMIGGWEDAQTMHKIYEHISAADRLKAENKIAEFFKNANENANKDETV